METGVARVRSDEDEPCGMGWRARGEQGRVGVSQAVGGEEKSTCLGWQEHRPGFPTHISLFSACVKASSKASSPLPVLICIRDDNQLLLSITPLVLFS